MGEGCHRTADSLIQGTIHNMYSHVETILKMQAIHDWLANLTYQ